MRNKEGTSYFKKYTGIGPMFTNKLSEAMVCDERTDFANFIGHFATAVYSIVEIEV